MQYGRLGADTAFVHLPVNFLAFGTRGKYQTRNLTGTESCHIRAVTVRSKIRLHYSFWQPVDTYIVFRHREHRNGFSHSVLHTLQCRMMAERELVRLELWPVFMVAQPELAPIWDRPDSTCPSGAWACSMYHINYDSLQGYNSDLSQEPERN